MSTVTIPVPSIISVTPRLDELVVTWSKVTVANSISSVRYRVEFSIDNGQTWSSARSINSISGTSSTSGIFKPLSDFPRSTYNAASPQPVRFRVSTSANIRGISGTVQSAWSTPSNPVAPLGRTISSPTIVSVVPRINQLIITWTRVSVTGSIGSVGYILQYSIDNGQTWTNAQFGSTFTSYTFNATSVPGYSTINPSTFIFRVSATANTTAGTISSPPSTPSGQFKPLSALQGPPTNVELKLVETARSKTITVTWKDPNYLGINTLRDLRYSAEFSIDNGVTWRNLVIGLPQPMQGLTYSWDLPDITNKTSIIVAKVICTTSTGSSIGISNTIRLSTPPSQPLNLRARPKDSAATIIWDVPEDDGGAPIRQYDLLLVGFRSLPDAMQFNPNIANQPVQPLVVSVVPVRPSVETVNGVKKYYWCSNAIGQPGIAANDKTCTEDYETSVISVTKPDLNNGWNYAIYVRAYNIEALSSQYVDSPRTGTTYWTEAGNAGPWSAPAYVRPFTVPEQPTEVKRVSTTLDSVTIEWKNPFNNGGLNIRSYAIAYRDNSTQSNPVSTSNNDGNQWLRYDPPNTQTVNLEPNRRSATIPNLTNGKEYLFKVAAISPAGLGEWSETVRIRVGSDKPGLVRNFKIYPKADGFLMTWDPPLPKISGEVPVLYYTIAGFVANDCYVSGTECSPLKYDNSDNLQSLPPIRVPANATRFFYTREAGFSWRGVSFPNFSFTIRATNIVDDGDIVYDQKNGGWSKLIQGVPEGTVTNFTVEQVITNINLGQDIRFKFNTPLNIGNKYKIDRYTIHWKSTEGGEPWRRFAEFKRGTFIVENDGELTGSNNLKLQTVEDFQEVDPGQELTINATLLGRYPNPDGIVEFPYPTTGDGKTYQFRIFAGNSQGYALDDYGYSSVDSNEITFIAPPIPPVTKPILFDHSDLENLLIRENVSDTARWMNYFSVASNRIAKYIKYPNSYVDQIRSLGNVNAKGTGLFEGVYPARINFDFIEPTTENPYPWVAQISIGSIFPNRAPLTTYFRLDDKILAKSYYMRINQYYEKLHSDQVWIDTITHELLHALGIGISWPNMAANAFAGPGLLRGTVFPQTILAYNTMAFPGIANPRNNIPVENDSNPGSYGFHWENDYRPATGPTGYPSNEPYYYGLNNEIMTAYVLPTKMVLSLLTIKNLADLGYEEINPGTSEGNPTLVTSTISSISSNDLIIPMCGCGTHMPNR